MQLFRAGVLLIVIYSELHTVFEMTLKWPPHTSEMRGRSALSCEIRQGGRMTVAQDLFTYIHGQCCQVGLFSYAQIFDSICNLSLWFII